MPAIGIVSAALLAYQSHVRPSGEARQLDRCVAMAAWKSLQGLRMVARLGTLAW